MSIEQAFQNLKQALLESVVLTFPDRRKPYIVHTDASDVPIGATLSQEDQQGNLRLVACASRKLSSAERNYPAHEKECLAVVDSLQRWQHYLLGAVQVIVHTDNITLKYLNTMKDTSPRMNRWLEKLSRFNFEIRHIPVTTNTAADALSGNLSPSDVLLCLGVLDFLASCHSNPK